MIKKIIALMAVQSFFMIPALANDAEVIEIQKCPSMGNFSINPVKIISKDLFLDSDGYKVQACSANGEVKFFKVMPYANGIEIYNTTDVEEQLNEGNARIYNQEYSITYGNKNFEIQDRFDFQKEINKSFLSENVPIGTSSFVTETDYDDAKKILSFPSEWTDIGNKYVTYIQKEKEEIIKKKYQEIINELKQKAELEKQQANETFMQKATEMNKFFIHDNKVISQYSLDENNENLSVFLTYEGVLSGYKFYIASQELLADYVANPNIGLDEKVSVMENISIPFYEKKQGEFVELKKEKVQDIKNQKEMEKIGREHFSKLSETEKKEFLEMLENVNKNIIANEFENLPDKITKEQYKALSNIDKFKYVPELKGHYKDKNSYVKNKQDIVMNLVVSKK